MSVQITRNVNINGCEMPMMPMMSMGGCCTPAMPIFGTCCTPVPVMGCGIMNNDMAAGYCIGTALGNPGVLSAIGSGLKWGYNNLVLPVWNGVIKPVANWTYNNILKQIGSGLKWVWDHTLGWVLKKIGEATSKKTEKPQETTSQGTPETTDAEA